jgi:hypothetical protein
MAGMKWIELNVVMGGDMMDDFGRRTAERRITTMMDDDEDTDYEK